MKIESLNCPNCGVDLPDTIKPSQQFDCPACHSLLVLTDLVTDDQIICRACQTVNRDDRDHCRECGDQLKIHCPFCAIENSISAIHCRNCGVNLRQALLRRRSWRHQARQHRKAGREAQRQAYAAEKQANLARYLQDLDEPENHPMAIYGLQMLGDEAIEAVIAHLNDDDPDARYGAAQVLGRLRDERAITPLIACLQDQEPAVRYWAIDSLGKFQTKASLEAIGDLLRDGHKGVRTHAEDVLKAIGTPQAWRVLKEKKKAKWWPF